MEEKKNKGIWIFIIILIGLGLIYFVNAGTLSQYNFIEIIGLKNITNESHEWYGNNTWYGYSVFKGNVSFENITIVNFQYFNVTGNVTAEAYCDSTGCYTLTELNRTPNLQEVTDEGTTTTNQITIEDTLFLGESSSYSNNAFILNPSLQIGVASNSMRGMVFKNKNSGTSAGVRFAIENDQGDYISFLAPSSKRLLQLFGVNRKDGFFLFSNGLTDTDKKMGIGTVNEGDVIIGTNNIGRIIIDGTTGTSDFNGNVNISNHNITAAYFKGDGSLLTGIRGDNSSFNQTLTDSLYRNKREIYNVTLYAVDGEFGSGSLSFKNGTTIASFSNIGDGDIMFQEDIICDTTYILENEAGGDPVWIPWNINSPYIWLLLTEVGSDTVGNIIYDGGYIFQTAQDEQIGSFFTKLFFSFPCIFEDGEDIEILVQQANEG